MEQAVGVEVDEHVDIHAAAGEYEAEASAGAETDYADAVVDVGTGSQKVETALQVADSLGVGPGVECITREVEVGVFHDSEEPLAAVQGGDDGRIAQGGVAASHVLHVLFVAVDAVDEEQAGVGAALRWPGHVGGHRVAVVAADGCVVGDYVSRVVDQTWGHCSGNQSDTLPDQFERPVVRDR